MAITREATTGGKRRAGRVAALQALFGLDMRGLLDADADDDERPIATELEVEQALARQRGALVEDDDSGAEDPELPAALEATELEDPEVLRFALDLCQGVVAHLGEIDVLLGRSAVNWRVARMSLVDRNVLRLATFELRERPDVPTGVAINEAVELGKAFGTTESAGFINGVLDRVARSIR